MTTRKEIELAIKVVQKDKEIAQLRALLQQYQQGKVSDLFLKHGDHTAPEPSPPQP